MDQFTFVPYDVVYWMIDTYFGNGPLFQLIILQFVCKQWNRAFQQPHARCKARMVEFRNIAPAHRKDKFSKVGAKACEYNSVPVVQWFRKQLLLLPDQNWCDNAAKCKHLLITHLLFFYSFGKE